jgi:hypothetical protein
MTSPTWSSGVSNGLFTVNLWFDPESEVCGVVGDAPGFAVGWMMVLKKSRGRLTGLSSFDRLRFCLRFRLLQSDSEKNKISAFTEPSCCLSP